MPCLTTDRERLRQALGNLIDNAIKYSPAGSRVTVQANVDNGQLCIAVADEGPGIAPDVQPKVFDAFYRYHQDDAVPQQKGSGLGLTVVQCIVRLLGAEVGLQSTPGKGSTFSLLFPLCDAIQDDCSGDVGAFCEQKTE
ncbi:MAG: ATP-binding protein [Armatimonadetes bacterium]|nr:ATP-binding protein [Armatimonadota bacterium]